MSGALIRSATAEEQAALDAAFDAVRDRDPQEFDRLLSRHSGFGADAEGRIVPVEDALSHEILTASVNELRKRYVDFDQLQSAALTVAKAMCPIWGRITPAEFLEVAYLAVKYSAFAAPVRERIDFEAAPPVSQHQM